MHIIIFCIIFYNVFVYASGRISIITDKTFFDVLRSKTSFILFVYSPWCQYSTEVRQHLLTSVEALRTMYPYLQLKGLDGSKNPKTVKKLHLDRTPTILFLQNNDIRSVNTYNGDRSVQSLSDWILRCVQPGIKIFSSQDEIKQYAEYPNRLYVEHLALDSNPIVANIFKNVCKKHPDLNGVYGLFHDNEKLTPSLHVYRLREGLIAEIKEYNILTDPIRLYDVMTEEKYQFITIGSSDTLTDCVFNFQFVLWFIGTIEEYNQIKNIFLNAAKLLRPQKVRCVWLPAELYSSHAKSYLTVHKTPSFIFSKKERIPNIKETYYAYNGDIDTASSEDIVNFIHKCLLGELGEIKKSEYIKDTDIKNLYGVEKINRNKLEQIMNNQIKHVLIAVIAPWCPYSQKLLKSFNKLNNVLEQRYHHESIKNDTILHLYTIDGTKNDLIDIKHFNWNKYPTVFYLPAQNTRPVKYRGPGTIESFLLFLQRFAPEILGAGITPLNALQIIK